MPNGWYNVYVVELADAASLGTKPNPALPFLYVGITNNTPERRFEIHKEGGRTSNDNVRLHGIRLRPDLYRHYKRAKRSDAPEFEQRVANELRSKGYVVDSGGYGFFRPQSRR